MPHQVLEWQKTRVGLSVSTSGPRWNRMSVVHSGLSRNVCRAVNDCRWLKVVCHRVGKDTRKLIILTFLQNLNELLPCRQVCFDSEGIFSFPVTYPTWWFASLWWIIALQILSGFSFVKKKGRNLMKYWFQIIIFVRAHHFRGWLFSPVLHL